VRNRGTVDLKGIIRKELARVNGKTIVETGTIRSADDQYRIGDGWSTMALAEHARDHGGTVTSIDLDVSIARGVLAQQGLDGYVTLIEGHSVQVLARLAAEGRKFDVALLDSDNDAQLILDEYLVVSAMLQRPGLLLVDDVDLGSELVFKGHRLVPWLDREGVPYEIVQRDCAGYTTGVLIARLGWS
jgi:predicted O-methyltransferase YrrM